MKSCVLNLFSISKAGLSKVHASMSPESDFSAHWLSDTFCNNSLQVHPKQPQSTNTSFCHILVLPYTEFDGM